MHGASSVLRLLEIAVVPALIRRVWLQGNDLEFQEFVADASAITVCYSGCLAAIRSGNLPCKDLISASISAMRFFRCVGES
jgi:hypothetical protein